MKMRVKSVIFFFGLIAGSIGCKTPGKSDQGSPFTDGEDLPVSMDQDDEQLPTSLWSPMRRKANASFYFMVGEQEAMKGHASQAEQLFEAAYNLDPTAFSAWKLIAARANAGNLDQAMLLAKKMVLLYPKYADLHTLFGQLLARHGQLDEAATHYQRAISLQPDVVDPYVGLIQIRQVQKQPKEALAVAQDMVKADPTYADGWCTLAKLYLATGAKDKALEPARRAYELQSLDPEKVLVFALSLELNGKSKQAVHLYENLFRLNPTNEELIGRMVDLYRQLGDLNDALALIDEAIQSAGKDAAPGLKLQKSFILWELERYKEAANILEELAKEDPKSDRILYLVGLGRERLGKPDQALEAYAKIPSESQYRIHADYRTVNILRDQQHFDEAMALVKKVVGSSVDRSQEFYGLGASVLADADRLPEAVNFLEEGTKAHPENVSLLFLLGVYHEKNHDKASCIEVMRDVIKRDPQYSSAYNYLGYLFAESGENLEEAESLIKKALEIKPDDGYYMDSLGWVYYQKHEFKKALSTLSEAAKLAPDEGVILEHIADTYGALGEQETAVQYYEKALNGRIEKSDKERVEQKLRKQQTAKG